MLILSYSQPEKSQQKFHNATRNQNIKQKGITLITLRPRTDKQTTMFSNANGEKKL